MLTGTCVVGWLTIVYLITMIVMIIDRRRGFHEDSVTVGM